MHAKKQLLSDDKNLLEEVKRKNILALEQYELNEIFTKGSLPMNHSRREQQIHDSQKTFEKSALHLGP